MPGEKPLNLQEKIQSLPTGELQQFNSWLKEYKGILNQYEGQAKKIPVDMPVGKFLPVDGQKISNIWDGEEVIQPSHADPKQITDRLYRIGLYRGDDETITFVGPDGRYWVGHASEENMAALKKAGYKNSAQEGHVSFKNIMNADRKFADPNLQQQWEKWEEELEPPQASPDATIEVSQKKKAPAAGIDIEKEQEKLREAKTVQHQLINMEELFPPLPEVQIQTPNTSNNPQDVTPAPQTEQPPVPTFEEIILGDELIKLKPEELINHINRDLKNRTADKIGYKAAPEKVINYLKANKLKWGAKIKDADSAITGDQLILRGSITVPFMGDAHFEAVLAPGPTGHLAVISHQVETGWRLSKAKGQIEDNIAHLDQRMAETINPKINQAYQYSGLRINGNLLALDFKRE